MSAVCLPFVSGRPMALDSLDAEPVASALEGGSWHVLHGWVWDKMLPEFGCHMEQCGTQTAANQLSFHFSAPCRNSCPLSMQLWLLVQLPASAARRSFEDLARCKWCPNKGDAPSNGYDKLIIVVDFLFGLFETLRRHFHLQCMNNNIYHIYCYPWLKCQKGAGWSKRPGW